MNAVGGITVAKARLPATYVEAKQALAKCARVDECAAWADKAMALASYGKQAKDEALENLAQKILTRAIQRAGILLLELKAQPGKRTDREPKGASSRRLPTRKEAAKNAGLSEDQAKTMVEVARVPAEQFDSLVECDKPATVTELAELGTKKRKKQPRDPVCDQQVDWRWAIKALVEVPSCGFDAMAAFCPDLNPNNLEECKRARSNLEAWQSAIEKELYG